MQERHTENCNSVKIYFTFYHMRMQRALTGVVGGGWLTAMLLCACMLCVANIKDNINWIKSQFHFWLLSSKVECENATDSSSTSSSSSGIDERWQCKNISSWHFLFEATDVAFWIVTAKKKEIIFLYIIHWWPQPAISATPHSRYKTVLHKNEKTFLNSIEKKDVRENGKE